MGGKSLWGMINLQCDTELNNNSRVEPLTLTVVVAAGFDGTGQL